MSEVFVSGEEIKKAAEFLRKHGISPASYAEAYAILSKFEGYYMSKTGVELEQEKKKIEDAIVSQAKQSGVTEKEARKAVKEPSMQMAIDPLLRVRTCKTALLDKSASKEMKSSAVEMARSMVNAPSKETKKYEQEFQKRIKGRVERAKKHKH